MPYIKKYLNSYEYCFKKDGKIIHEDRASRDFIALVEKVGLTDIGLHTLRHTFISQCLMAGISIWEVAKWVGHSTAYMTELYGHLCPNRAGEGNRTPIPSLGSYYSNNLVKY
ncbi:MAG: hypothetical protein DWB56_15685 [Candidatus Jettenia sp.]|nr:hypothetical protein [Candidatus Jettenia sp.]